jgi:hypothetical protein
MTELDEKYLKWIGYNDYEIETYEGESYKETNQYDAYMAGYAQGETDEKFRTKPIVVSDKWHKVSEEGLPKNNNDGATYLLYTIYGPGGSPVVAHFKERDSQLLMNTWTGAILTEDKIVSWKECKLPTE